MVPWAKKYVFYFKGRAARAFFWPRCVTLGGRVNLAANSAKDFGKLKQHGEPVKATVSDALSPGLAGRAPVGKERAKAWPIS